jgi:hypothetical protein
VGGQHSLLVLGMACMYVLPILAAGSWAGLPALVPFGFVDRLGSWSILARHLAELAALGVLLHCRGRESSAGPAEAPVSGAEQPHVAEVRGARLTFGGIIGVLVRSVASGSVLGRVWLVAAFASGRLQSGRMWQHRPWAGLPPAQRSDHAATLDAPGLPEFNTLRRRWDRAANQRGR